MQRHTNYTNDLLVKRIPPKLPLDYITHTWTIITTTVFTALGFKALNCLCLRLLNIVACSYV